ncbi:MAG: STAS domain-containing protein [Gammaproteobacteria bacterium]|jgi:phospholipid transport system transporter-binding protein
MTEARIEVAADGSIAIIGELNHQNVPTLLKKSADIVLKTSDQHDELVIDLGAVVRSDSAGVALLIEWMRQAKKNNKTILFNNTPKQMHEIAMVSGVDKMLAM